MTILRAEVGGYDVSCDHCSTEEWFDEDHFDTVVEEMKIAGWKIRKAGQHWDHSCPVCVEEHEG